MVHLSNEDLNRLLNECVKHKYKDEIVKLLTPMLTEHSLAGEKFVQCVLGNKLEKVHPLGTLIKIPVDKLGYGSNKDNIRAELADSNGYIVAIIKNFKGYHSHTNYQIEYTNVSDAGVKTQETTFVSFEDFSVMEDF
jgi:hypothetical protein